MENKFIIQISRYQKLINQKLDKYLPRRGLLARAMRYSVFAGGKRIRPILCLATAKALGCSKAKVLPFACAVELLHTFTLIHDDLPAMDDSDFRRGKPTCHKVFGEDIAILAGDALNTLAFNIISDFPEASWELSKALMDVVEGQVADLRLGSAKVTIKKLISVHRRKTGALLQACVRGTAFLCHASPKQISCLTAYADHLGLAFQISDDILDVTATRKQLGKPVKHDVKKGFPYVVGLEKAKRMMEKEKEKAVAALEPFGQKAEELRKIALYVVERRN